MFELFNLSEENITERLSEKNINIIISCLIYFFDFYLSNFKFKLNFIKNKDNLQDSYFLIDFNFSKNKKKYFQKIYHKMPVYARELFDFSNKFNPIDCRNGFLWVRPCKHCKELIMGNKKIEYVNNIKINNNIVCNLHKSKVNI